MHNTVRNPPCGPRQTTADGFILVAALWIIAALATLASIFSIYLAKTATSLSLNDSTVQSEALVVASLELTAYQVSAPPPAAPPARRDANVPPPPTRGDFGFRLWRADVAGDLTNAPPPIDLTFSAPHLLPPLFAHLLPPPHPTPRHS